jgi:pimeloyl-ACP methyl ester carboxylesterase
VGSASLFTRRRALVVGLSALGGVAVAGAAGFELVDHGVLPGKSLLDQLDGACDVTVPNFEVRPVGRSHSGTFYSRHRNRTVGYIVGYPPGYSTGDVIPLVVMLHGEGGSHRHALAGMTPAQAVALVVDGTSLPPMALVTVDGGRGYWHPHPGDDPMGMVVDELIPMLQSWGLGRGTRSIGVMGISMGGYGALLFAECYPHLFGVVTAISPAIWTSYAQAQAVNSAAYDNSVQFARYDVVTHAGALAGVPTRIASGYADSFHSGVVALSEHLGRDAQITFSGGCHTGSFFESQEPVSLHFLGSRLHNV